MAQDPPAFIRPDWPAPPRVKAVTTTRPGGVSQPPYATFNLGAHVGDGEAAVQKNREILRQALALPAAPCWLEQVHGNRVVDVSGAGRTPRADGCVTHQAGQVCAVMTADCLPILLCHQSGASVAALHGGWRGLAAGIIAAGVAAQECSASQLMAWLGPAIGPRAFEVGEDVRDAFLALDPGHADAFVRSGDRWLADIYRLARHQLEALGVTAVYGGRWCTCTDAAQFYSFRRDGKTGRMASLIWIEEQEAG